jgi:hypothetical protein
VTPLSNTPMPATMRCCPSLPCDTWRNVVDDVTPCWSYSMARNSDLLVATVPWAYRHTSISEETGASSTAAPVFGIAIIGAIARKMLGASWQMCMRWRWKAFGWGQSPSRWDLNDASAWRVFKRAEVLVPSMGTASEKQNQ